MTVNIHPYHAHTVPSRFVFFLPIFCQYMILYKYTVKIWEGFHGWGRIQPDATKVGLCAIHR